jgi:hypothetical protein
MRTDDIERLIKLHQSVTDREIQKLLLRLLQIEVEKRGAVLTPMVVGSPDFLRPDPIQGWKVT